MSFINPVSLQADDKEVHLFSPVLYGLSVMHKTKEKALFFLGCFLVHIKVIHQQEEVSVFFRCRKLQSPAAIRAKIKFLRHIGSTIRAILKG
jgi:hypothetical protein